MDENRRQFLAEAEDLIEQVFVGLDELRLKPKQSWSQRSLVDEIFRRIHRLKGSAASFGFDSLSEIAHEFENLLSALRAGQIPLNAEALDICESATTALLEGLQLASSGVVEPSHRSLFERIRTLTQGSTHVDSTHLEAILAQIPEEFCQLLSDEERQRLAEALGEGTHLCFVNTNFDTAGFDTHFTSLRHKLSEYGEVISSSPTVETGPSDRINFRILYVSNSPAEVVNAALVDFPGTAVDELARPAEASEPVESGGRSAPSIMTSAANFIRLDAEELDRLISSTHELFLTTARALDLARSETDPGPEVQHRLLVLDEKIRRSFLGVEEELIGLRMTSLGPVLQRAARAGRAAARQCEKDVDFQIVGTNLRVDRVLCSAIADPLIHLVRNAVDHGISAKEHGLVRIEASSLGGQTCIRVVDNGRGVDPELVAAAAQRMAIMDKDAVYDMARSLRLIFRPGFTTLSSPSKISGRGVGLDVVEAAVEQVGGEVRVSSEIGKGSTFEIRLPATFGLIQATVLRSGSNYYCIDSSQVVSTDVFSDSQIGTAERGEIYQSGNGVVPMVRMQELLGQPLKESSVERPAIIICEIGNPAVKGEPNGNKRLAILVDEVRGTEELLVRSLGRHAGRWTGISGAAELRDGTVALVLDLTRLIQSQKK